MPGDTIRDPDEALFRPILQTGWRFHLTVAVLGAVILWSLYAYIHQLRYGLGVTGLNRPTYWGVYIVNFVFFIGVSHAGTLISAILRLARAEWRRSITRAAEVITVLVLFFGVANIIMDMGRPDLLFYVVWYAHFSSPLLWDVVSIAIYLGASTVYLYLPLIPDIALLRERVTDWRRPLYRALALGWQDTPQQVRLLNRAIAVMAVLVIPVAVAVHTVVAWVFSMTIQPLWHSSIFGPYFVMGAIYSGISALILAMGVIRRGYHLEAYLKPVHFRHLGSLLLVLNLLWFYFALAEHITVFYGKEPHEMQVLNEHLIGRYAPAFWAMVGLMTVVFIILVAERLPVFVPRVGAPPGRIGTVIRASATAGGFALALWLFGRPVPTAPDVPSLVGPARGVFMIDVEAAHLMMLHLERGAGVLVLALITLVWWQQIKRHPIAAVMMASALVAVGMWLERLVIVVPSLINPRLEYERGLYQPTWVEWSLLAGSLAAFLLLYVLFTKLFPIVSIWEVKEGRERAIPETEERIREYLPTPSA